MCDSARGSALRAASRRSAAHWPRRPGRIAERAATGVRERRRSRRRLGRRRRSRRRRTNPRASVRQAGLPGRPGSEPPPLQQASRGEAAGSSPPRIYHTLRYSDRATYVGSPSQARCANVASRIEPPERLVVRHAARPGRRTQRLAGQGGANRRLSVGSSLDPALPSRVSAQEGQVRCGEASDVREHSG